jgi:hypothetical protein
MLNELYYIGLRYHDTQVAGQNFYLLHIFLSFIMIDIPIHILCIIKFLALKKKQETSVSDCSACDVILHPRPEHGTGDG